MDDERINGWWTATEALRHHPQLVDATLVWHTYSQPAPDWDHDHCVLCSTKLMENAAEDVLDAAYTDDVALAASPLIEGLQPSRAGTRTWICPTCAEAYRRVFDWQIDGGPLEAA
jgi:hypothetical protein